MKKIYVLLLLFVPTLVFSQFKGRWKNFSQDSSFVSATADSIKARSSSGLYLVDDSGTKGIFIKDGGNVGIGTTVPGAKLDIASSGSTIGLKVDGNKTTGNLLQIFNDNDGSPGDSGMVMLSNGNVGIGEVAPITLTEWSSTAPYLTLHNTTEEDGEGGRESKIIARGEQSGGEETILGYMGFAHDGTSDDQKGLFCGYLNNGSDGVSPTKAWLMDVSGHNYFGLSAGNNQDYSNGFGSSALSSNTGAYSNGFGHYSLSSNTGASSNGFGYSVLKYNDGDNNSSFGNNAFNTFTEDAGNAQTFASTDVIVTGDSIVISSHGFGSADTYVNLKWTATTGVLPTGISLNQIDMFYIAHVDTIVLQTDNMTAQGSGNHTLTPQSVYTNSTALGYNAEPDASNQVMLGDVNVTQIKSTGNLYISGTNDNYINGNVGVGTAEPASKIHIDAVGGTDGTGTRIDNASVSTTDATPTTLFTLATASNLAYRITADIIGAQDDGSNSMGATWCFTIKNVAGTVTEQGDSAIQETDDSAGVTVSGAVSGTDYLIQVTGIGAENWNWEASINITAVAH